MKKSFGFYLIKGCINSIKYHNMRFYQSNPERICTAIPNFSLLIPNYFHNFPFIATPKPYSLI